VATNLELKCRRASDAADTEIARRLGAVLHATLFQSDTYFHVPHGRLKLRRIDATSAELIQYERPDTKGDRWSSYTRLPVEDPDALERALGQTLGIRCAVKKSRTVYLYRTARIHVDDVAGLGSFLEFEVVETAPEEAAALMQELRHAFSVNENDVIAGSYGDMVLDPKVEQNPP
jgi:predicted adenylyl cyclase CyaB